MRKSRGVTTYSGAHRNTVLRRGKAESYRCPCGEPAAEWALMHDASNVVTDGTGKTFSLNPDDYQAMCCHCHRAYDKSAITHCPREHPYQGENVYLDAGKRKCRTCTNERNRRARLLKPLTPEQRQRKTATRAQGNRACRVSLTVGALTTTARAPASPSPATTSAEAFCPSHATRHTRDATSAIGG